MISKATAILSGTLLAGILFTGIGTGIAAVEYSSLEIDTTTLTEKASKTTESFVYELGADERIEVANPNCQVVFDDSVPQGTVLMEVTYAPELCYINYYSEAYHDEAGKPFTSLHLYTYYRGYDSTMLQYKDLILQGLKDGVLYVYDDMSYNENDNSIKLVKFNPADKDHLLTYSPEHHSLNYTGEDLVFTDNATDYPEDDPSY